MTKSSLLRLFFIKRIQDQICSTLDTIAHYDPDLTLELNDLTSTVDFDADDQESNLFSVGKKVKIALEDMDYVTWKQDLEEDFNTLYVLVNTVSKITPEHDSKLQILLDTIAQKIENPLNPGNKKLIIFTAFSDTAEYLYDNVSRFAQSEFGLNTALVTGTPACWRMPCCLLWTPRRTATWIVCSVPAVLRLC